MSKRRFDLDENESQDSDGLDCQYVTRKPKLNDDHAQTSTKSFQELIRNAQSGGDSSVGGVATELPYFRDYILKNMEMSHCQ